MKNPDSETPVPMGRGVFGSDIPMSMEVCGEQTKDGPCQMPQGHSGSIDMTIYNDNTLAAEAAIAIENIFSPPIPEGCTVNPIESRTCERETSQCTTHHGTEDMHYMCVACTKPIYSTGMCKLCSRAWGLGRQHGLNRAAEHITNTDVCSTDLAKDLAKEILKLKG